MGLKKEDGVETQRHSLVGSRWTENAAAYLDCGGGSRKF